MVDLPTPPFPDKTNTTWETFSRDLWRVSCSCWALAIASGELKAPDEQAALLGQPSQALADPADSEVGPTHPSFAFDGMSMFVADDDIV
jgi:hypothetical protein